MYICSVSRTLTNLRSASYILNHSSKSDSNFVFCIDLSRKLSYQNTPLKPHMYHNIEACLSNIRGSNQIYYYTSRRLSITPDPSLHQIKYINIRTILIQLSPEMDDLVVNYEGLSSVTTLPHLHSSCSLPSWIKCYLMEFLFFLRV